MQGDYRLWRQVGGRGAFAHVYVQVATWDQSSDQVVVALEATGPGIATPQSDPDWFAGAVEGARSALAALEAMGIATKSYQVRIINLVYMDTDTTPEAIRAATFLATAQAFGRQEAFRLVFQGEWVIVPQYL